MTGLDTNVLVRYLTQDDPAQAAKASRVIESARAAELFISDIVVCETVWVLEDVFDSTRDQIAAVVEKILRTAQFTFADAEMLWRALDDYRTGKGDLSDHLLGRVALKAGFDHTLTFDKGLRSSGAFRLL